MLHPELLTTDDGSHTLRHPLLGDCYHSGRGAVGESMHVFIGAGMLHRLNGGNNAGPNTTPLQILEAGFGSGLNALLTFRQAQQSGCSVGYTAVELYPIDLSVASVLNYRTIDEGTYAAAFDAMHAAPWDEPTAISSFFSLHKIRLPLQEYAGGVGRFDLVYFDAFSPDTQPELWSEELFVRLHGMMAAGGVLVTYSSKGMVKRNLRAAGFSVERLPGALGKRHMLRAVKRL